MLFDNLPGSLPSVRSGAIRPAAVRTAKKRLALSAPVLAFAELLPGDPSMTSWTAKLRPANMPADPAAQVNALTVKAWNAPWVQQRYADLGATDLADHAAGDLSDRGQRGRPGRCRS